MTCSRCGKKIIYDNTKPMIPDCWVDSIFNYEFPFEIKQASEPLLRGECVCKDCMRWIDEKCTETTLDVNRVYPNCHLKTS